MLVVLIFQACVGEAMSRAVRLCHAIRLEAMERGQSSCRLHAIDAYVAALR